VLQALWGRQAEEIFADCLEAPGVNPEVGALWVRRWTARGQWRNRQRIYRLAATSPLGVRARVAYIEEIADRKKPRYLRRLLRRERAALRSDMQLWGTVGYASLQLLQAAEAVEWLSDWPRRSGLQPWMLSNHVIALRELGRERDATETSRRALDLRQDHTTHQHQLWVACEAALTGDRSIAVPLLAEARGAAADGYFGSLAVLTEALLTVQNAAPADRWQIHRAELHRLHQPECRELFQNRSLKRLYRRGAMQMARWAHAPFRRLRAWATIPGFVPRGPVSFGRWWVVVVFVLINILVRSCPPESPRSRPSTFTSHTLPVFATPTPRPPDPLPAPTPAGRRAIELPLSPTDARRPPVMLELPPEFTFPTPEPKR
jgi:hypothetical protein